MLSVLKAAPSDTVRLVESRRQHGEQVRAGEALSREVENLRARPNEERRLELLVQIAEMVYGPEVAMRPLDDLPAIISERLHLREIEHLKRGLRDAEGMIIELSVRASNAEARTSSAEAARDHAYGLFRRPLWEVVRAWWGFRASKI